MRNYKNEMLWQKEKYTRLTAKLDKGYVKNFKEKLKDNDEQYATWLRTRIDEYMNN